MQGVQIAGKTPPEVMQEDKIRKVCPDLCFGEEIAFLVSSRDQIGRQEPGCPQSVKGNESQGRINKFGVRP